MFFEIINKLYLLVETFTGIGKDYFIPASYFNFQPKPTANKYSQSLTVLEDVG